MTPAHLAAYIARGIPAIEPFDLPAVLDALKAERAKAQAAIGDDPPTIGEPALVTFTRATANRIDAAIAEIEHALNPCLNTLTGVRHTAAQVAYDALVLVEKTTESP